MSQATRPPVAAASLPSLGERLLLSPPPHDTKYVVVTGGVLSGVGKGVLASSTGVILKSRGINITHVKIDPYINIDAGCMSPYEHGEVFVLDDGGEVDLDLGNYERFGDITLTSDHNITTGKMYMEVIQAERRGAYLGKTVQVVPHVCNAVKDWINRVARMPVSRFGGIPQVCIIELGGTIGDIESMPFIEAMRQMQYETPAEDFALIHVSLVPTIGSEAKTKPTQHSVKTLRGLGLSPNVIVCRSQDPLPESVRAKIALNGHVQLPQVLSVYNLANVFHVPCLLEDNGLTDYLMSHLQLVPDEELVSAYSLSNWRLMATAIDKTTTPVSIALVGKYLDSASDTYHSLIKALNHAAYAAHRKLNLVLVEAPSLEKAMLDSDAPEYHATWAKLCSADGVIVPGGFGERGFEGKMAAAKWCREHKIPFLGICLGLQVAVIEYARSVLRIIDAASEEMDSDAAEPVILNMPEVSTTQLGGTMRLGSRPTDIAHNTLAHKLYGTDIVYERHRHRYEVNPEYIDRLEAKGELVFSGKGDENRRMEIVELKSHPFYFATQFHPEYTTRPLVPSPPFLGLLLAASSQLDHYLATGCIEDPHASRARAKTPRNVVPEWSTPPPTPRTSATQSTPEPTAAAASSSAAPSATRAS
ncbi:CTP synthase [Thecamonas trahens ATCC 50062]|uniref:CTP synthase n=1 Tax=Thecamonas trahens ATCC 50062 TaxID=461836 RepID=A0A0L0D5P1_THETB|nr:CTP synthase [Thecamonas trahens ATCC 50062]KNC47664.1 CTP synthase [Thecamonas trahens ATCC 50062]|eukprot:XP_013759148.1 CTP synthase [Thecamonas trahens ATCC 50062]